jgi:hypothetical protein
VLEASSSRQLSTAASAISLEDVPPFRTAALLIGLRWFSGWKSIPIRPLSNFSPNSKLAIQDCTAAAICVRCGDAYRSGAEKRFSG